MTPAEDLPTRQKRPLDDARSGGYFFADSGKAGKKSDYVFRSRNPG